ncbi:sensor histidine kinase [Yimella sp. cx-51]|uniref:sensor histidine kinase n=1 Tax=Yimella sp. cx-51 TaxID=2770551 RepID=UPI00165D56FD|nr:sensor histidine kinase [Yimella sp. cx-51]MBC9956685.1 sensor histidine kinase [Yimella sp. cx-51]QTH38924.1 sensor histidine kinase [Yimella sp. cx-51]
MPTLNDVLGHHGVSEDDSDWLHRLVGDWQLIADLSFADLVLWVRTDADDWLAAAHVRPTTGVGVFPEDMVATRIAAARTRMVRSAHDQQQIVRAGQTVWRDDMPIREEAIPVVRGDRTVAVLTRHTNLASMRTPSRLEVTYLATADALARMIAAGAFPQSEPIANVRRGAPRVGDGVLRLSADGMVSYASPNAVSAVHRLGHEGDVIGVHLASAVHALLPPRQLADEDLGQILQGRVAHRGEAQTRSATVMFRSIPLVETETAAESRTGAVLLVRDVSELRRREQELATKDVTIREIHHRVKNNLQTVAAVLRLQARRIDDTVARAALGDAVRRVATIASVHETLSSRLDDQLDFDDVARQGLQAALELGNRGGVQVTGRLEGTFGVLRSEDATALAMVLAELVQNAVEHGLAEQDGTVVVDVLRTMRGEGDLLSVEVRDDGAGLPGDFDPGRSGLGTQIVRSLVTDLGGDITWSATTNGTAVKFTAVLRETSDGR